MAELSGAEYIPIPIKQSDIAYNFSEDTWVNFKLFGMMGLTLVFVFAQAFYLSRYLQSPEGSE